MESQREVYLNGRFVPRSKAGLDIEDRGVLFADGVCEVIRYYQGRGPGVDAHLAILHRGPVVTEAMSANGFIVRDGRLQTHPEDQWILGGITRSILLDLALARGMPVEEVPFTVEQLASADEVLVCGTTTHVAAVTQIDYDPVGDGTVGPVARRLQSALLEHITEVCGR